MPPHANAARHCWSWTPSRMAMPHVSMSAWAGSVLASFPAMHCCRAVVSAARPCTIATSASTRLFPRLAQERDEVAVRDRLDVVLPIATARQERRDPCEVRDGLDVRRGLLATESAVEIAADAHVPHVAGDLADVVDV